MDYVIRCPNCYHASPAFLPLDSDKELSQSTGGILRRFCALCGFRVKTDNRVELWGAATIERVGGTV